jgi:hypothetical protein
MKKVFLIINDEVQEREIDESMITSDYRSDFMPYYIDDYGMGSVDWSIIDHPREAYQRQLKDNVLWAKQRLIWATKNAPNELDELNQIIETSGKTRLPEYLEYFKTLETQ